MSCRKNEIGFVYFGSKILQKLSSEGIEISEKVYKSLFDFLKNYAREINENIFSEKFFEGMYLKVKNFLKT